MNKRMPLFKDHEEDQALMLRIAHKDMDAYKILLSKHLSSFTRFAERMIGDHGDAKDIMQELCLKLWKSPELWQPTARFTTWFYRVLFNACIDHKRKKRPVFSSELEQFEDGAINQEQLLIERQKLQNVQDAVQTLPERQRAALVLCYYEELSNQQAAEILGVNIGTLQQLLFRARQNLKALLMPMVMEQGGERHG